MRERGSLCVSKDVRNRIYAPPWDIDSSRLSELGIDIPRALVPKWWFGLRPWLKERRRGESREPPAFLPSRLGESRYLSLREGAIFDQVSSKCSVPNRLQWSGVFGCTKYTSSISPQNQPVQQQCHYKCSSMYEPTSLHLQSASPYILASPPKKPFTTAVNN